MANRRMLSKSIKESKKVLRLYNNGSDKNFIEFALLLYTWLIPFTDDYGRMDGESDVVKNTVMPFSGRPINDFDNALTVLSDVDLIRFYFVNNERFLEITQFEKFQTLRADKPRVSEFPSPTKESEFLIRDYLIEHLVEFNPNLTFIKKEFDIRIPHSKKFLRVDILASDENNNFVAIEVKRDVVKPFVITQQILEYLKHLGVNSRGVCAGPGFTEETISEAKKSNIELWTLSNDCLKTVKGRSDISQDVKQVKGREVKGREVKNVAQNLESFALPSQEELENFSDPKLDETLEQACNDLYQKKIFIESFSFKNKMVKENKNKRAILHALSRCLLKKPPPADAWGYCLNVLKVENGNFNERDYRKIT